MYMDKTEIVNNYKLAKDKKAQIQILAELNACSASKIREVLLSGGVDPGELPRIRRKREGAADEEAKDRNARTSIGETGGGDDPGSGKIRKTPKCSETDEASSGAAKGEASAVAAGDESGKEEFTASSSEKSTAEDGNVRDLALHNLVLFCAPAVLDSLKDAKNRVFELDRERAHAYAVLDALQAVADALGRLLGVVGLPGKERDHNADA